MPELSIYNFVSAQAGHDKVIDVNLWTRTLAPLFPELTQKQIQVEVLRAVCAHGGAASWGKQADNISGSEGSKPSWWSPQNSPRT